MIETFIKNQKKEKQLDKEKKQLRSKIITIAVLSTVGSLFAYANLNKTNFVPELMKSLVNKK